MEARFQLNEFVDKQNCWIWGTENPQVIYEKCCIHDEKLFGGIPGW